MEKRKLTGFSVSHLSNENAYSLFQSTIEISIPVRTQLGSMLSAILNELTENTEKLGEQINALQKSKLTDPIANQDVINDNLLAEIKRTVVYMSKSRDPQKKAAAQELDFLFQPYWSASKQPIKTQTDLIKEMLLKFNGNRQYIAAAELIGIMMMLSELDTSNTELSTLFLNRNAEAASKAPSGSDLRPAVAQSYTQFCDVLLQTVNFTPNDALMVLLNNVEQLRKKYAPLATESKTKSNPAVDAPVAK